MSEAFTYQDDEFSRLPKVDLHRHLEGSLRLQTLLDVAKKHDIPLPANTISLSRLVQVQDEDNLTFENFLKKFNTLRMFYRSPDIIERITTEAIEDAANDNIRYLELRFTPVALSRAERFPLNEVIDWVCESAQKGAKKYGVMVRLIASVNRHESIELAEQVVWLSTGRSDGSIVGLDLAGNEAQNPALPFLGLFNEARQSGLKITIHAGEWGGPENVREALEKFSADRIGHGVRILEDAFTTSLAHELATPFEICMTSNYQTGVVQNLSRHPIKRMLAAGLNVTLNTDDPSISQITLGNEFRVAANKLNISKKVLSELTLASAQAAFLPEAEKANLVNMLTQELSK